jgi:hypothetical protein
LSIAYKRNSMRAKKEAVGQDRSKSKDGRRRKKARGKSRIVKKRENEYKEVGSQARQDRNWGATDIRTKKNAGEAGQKEKE